MRQKEKIWKRVTSLAVLSMAFHLIVYSGSLFGYSTSVHKQITLEAVDKIESSLNERLEQIGLESGVDHILEKMEIKQWIQYGSHWEDYIALYWFSELPKKNIINCHFHNPLYDMGLYEEINGVREEKGESLIYRANDYVESFNSEWVNHNEWAYQIAKELYYAALTGDSTKYSRWIMRDKRIDSTAFDPSKENMTQKEREQFFAWTFQALGHTLHLIQDASVPAHTRNDSHGAILGFGDPEPFEDWTNRNRNNDDLMQYDGDGSDSWSYWAQNPIIKVPDIFIDTNTLSGESESLNQGLAEYSYANFLSKDSMFDFDLPEKPPSIDDIPNYDDDVVTFESDIVNGQNRSFLYLKSRHPGGVEHLALCGIFYHVNLGPLDTYSYKVKYTVDDPLVNEDYAKKLIPRAVGYSAGLLDYFFRGRLEISALPVFAENSIYWIRLKIKNVTPTEETMTMSDEDRLVLVCRYTPDGADPDGSEDKFVTANAYSCIDGSCDTNGNLDEIQYGDEATINFYLPEEEESRIGMQIVKSAEDSVKCMLVFKGKLGQEESAVIGKYFTLGQDQIRFNEEWDNELTGNYAWEHTQPDDPQNPDNGTTSNVIVSTDTSSNSLIKDNVRYAGYSQARFNETFVDFNDEITPYTYLQFKIDDLSITGTTAQHWQAMVLHFNEGRYLQLSQSGQGTVMNDTTATYTFTLGANMNLNIFEMFQDAGISIPDSFYIESIDFIQQLFQESPPPDTETSQHMEIDYIRIIEEKQEE